MASVLAYLFFVNVLSSLLRSNLQVEGFRLQDDGQSDPWKGFEKTSENTAKNLLEIRKFEKSTKTEHDIVNLVQSFTPLLPPPAGVALGGCLSLLKGIMGWRDTNLDDILNAINNGFAALGAQLEDISKKLDHVITAVREVKVIVGRIEAKVDKLLILENTGAVTTVQDIFTDIMSVIQESYRNGWAWSWVVSKMKQDKKNLEDAIRKLKPDKANIAIDYVLNHQAQGGGWCKAKEVFEEFVLARMQAFTLLYAMEAVSWENNEYHKYPQAAQTDLSWWVTDLANDMADYWTIQATRIGQTGTLFSSGKTGLALYNAVEVRSRVYSGTSMSYLNNWDDKEKLCKDAGCSGYCKEDSMKPGFKYMFYGQHPFMQEKSCTPGTLNCQTCFIRNSERCWYDGVPLGKMLLFDRQT